MTAVWMTMEAAIDVPRRPPLCSTVVIASNMGPRATRHPLRPLTFAARGSVGLQGLGKKAAEPTRNVSAKSTTRMGRLFDFNAPAGPAICMPFRPPAQPRVVRTWSDVVRRTRIHARAARRSGNRCLAPRPPNFFSGHQQLAGSPAAPGSPAKLPFARNPLCFKERSGIRCRLSDSGPVRLSTGKRRPSCNWNQSTA